MATIVHLLNAERDAHLPAYPSQNFYPYSDLVLLTSCFLPHGNTSPSSCPVSPLSTCPWSTSALTLAPTPTHNQSVPPRPFAPIISMICLFLIVPGFAPPACLLAGNMAMHGQLTLSSSGGVKKWTGETCTAR